MKKIGIIGGAGPMASCQLYKNVIRYCQSKYGCKDDKDYPEIVIMSFPFSDMLYLQDKRANRVKLMCELQYCFNKLASMGVEITGIACNTLHTLLNDVKIPSQFVHIAQATLNRVQKSGVEQVLVLATQTTILSGLYAAGNCLYPSDSEQQIINGVIANILAGNIDADDSTKIAAIIQKYVQNGSTVGVILGCTELPLLHEYASFVPDAARVEVFDTLAILSEELVKKNFKMRKNDAQ